MVEAFGLLVSVCKSVALMKRDAFQMQRSPAIARDEDLGSMCSLVFVGPPTTSSISCEWAGRKQEFLTQCGGLLGYALWFFVTAHRLLVVFRTLFSPLLRRWKDTLSFGSALNGMWRDQTVQA
jgi:hypothetical protein